ncbi:MAG: hypothetical protein RBT76_07970 [candidate division Zixibacteria bacterium]|jgi:ligand-binding sensor domain-containing protein|nr:hypothetical protein [candidate division Zixibacteria bacterium]
MMRRIGVVSAALLFVVAFASGAGAVRLSRQAVTFTDYNYINYVTASMKRVYFATTNGVIRYNKDLQRWDDPLVLPREVTEVLRVWVDVFDQRLFIETPVSYYEYDVTLDAWYSLIDMPQVNNSDIRHLPIPRNMMPPFGYNYSGNGDLIDPDGNAYQVTDVLDDGAGTLWIGTWGYGAARANAVTNALELLPFGLLQRRVNAIWLEDSTLWVSGAIETDVRSGISAFDLRTGSFQYYETGLTNTIRATDVNCLEGDDEFVYFGTPLGLYILDRDNMTVREHYDYRRGLSDDNVISLRIVGDSLFVGTAAGLTVISFGRDSIYYVSPQELANQVVYDMEPAMGYVWIGAQSGAYRYRLSDGALQRFEDPTSVLFGPVYDIERNGDVLWLASDDGVVRVNLRTADIVPYHEITARRGGRALAVNDEVAALSSDRGVTLIFHDRDEPFSREFTVEDGIADGTVYSLKMDGRYLWIGTSRGLTRFLWDNPERVD